MLPPKLGVRFEERLTGTWHTVEKPAEERPMELTVVGHLPDVSSVLGDATAKLEGRIVAEGLTDGSVIEGTLGIGALLRERRIPYKIDFTAMDGRRYRLDGAKEVSIMGLTRSFTLLPAYVFDDQGEEVGRAVLRFNLREEFVRSLFALRPTLG